VRSMVRRAEFIWRRMGSKGDSSRTSLCQTWYKIKREFDVRPVLSQLLSARASG
jgi:hypothetical protein